MELSPNLENVDIRAWAQQIREMKIKELQELITKREDYIRGFDPKKEDHMSRARVHALSDISRLGRKLKTLKTTT